MSHLSDALDELAFDEAAALTHPRRCACARCRQRAHERVQQGAGCGCGESWDESSRIWASGAARRQTSARMRGAQLPLWRNWSRPVSLATLTLHANNPQRPTELRPFFTSGGEVYRITRAGRDTTRPLNIGFTRLRIYDRIMQHRTGRGGDPNVTKALRRFRDDQILIQAAIIARSDVHARQAHLYEVWLQHRERPVLYSRNTNVFDEAARRNPMPQER